jgi:hypothetical protein
MGESWAGSQYVFCELVPSSLPLGTEQDVSRKMMTRRHKKNASNKIGLRWFAMDVMKELDGAKSYSVQPFEFLSSFLFSFLFFFFFLIVKG